MFSLLITIISIREVAEMTSGITRHQTIEQEKLIHEINGRVMFELPDENGGPLPQLSNTRGSRQVVFN